MGTLATVLFTILSVAASFGLQAAADAIDRKRVEKGKMKPDQMVSLINNKLADIQRRSSEAYNAAMDKISSIPAIMEAGSLREYMNGVRRQASNTLNAARKNYNDVESAASDLKNRVTNLANQSDSYKASKAGQQEYQDLKRDTDNIITKFSQEVQNVEKKIS